MVHASKQRPRFSEEWLVAVLDSLSEGVIALDADGLILAANPAAEDLLGFQLSESRYEPWDALSWDELVDEDDAVLSRQDHPVRATLADRDPRSSRVVGLHGSWGVRWLGLATHVLPTSPDDPPGAVVVSFHDRTQRVQAEHERRRLIDLMREFMTSVAHDLRTPLSTIAGWANMLGSDWESMDADERRTALGSMIRQSDHLRRLVDDLSVVGRLEAGGVAVDQEPILVTELVELAIDGLADGPMFEVEVPNGLQVLVDPDHGRRMLLNLVENAGKYGQAPFTISATGSDGTVQLAVSDQGPGVPPDFVPLLFERFTRSSSRRSAGGTGLGLAIVAGLAELNGGSVHYEHSDTSGARFVVTLPSVG